MTHELTRDSNTYVAGSKANIERIEQAKSERGAEILSFIDGTMSPEDKAKFVEELRLDRDLRIAVIQTRSATPDEIAAETFTGMEEEYEEGASAMKDFAINSPGSDFVAGQEFTSASIHIRGDFYRKAKDAFERALTKGVAEDLVLENIWRMDDNYRRVQSVDRNHFPAAEYAGFVSTFHGRDYYPRYLHQPVREIPQARSV